MMNEIIFAKIRDFKNSIQRWEKKMMRLRTYFDPIQFYYHQYQIVLFKLKYFSIFSFLQNKMKKLYKNIYLFNF